MNWNLPALSRARIAAPTAALLVSLAGPCCASTTSGAESWIRAVAATGGVANLALRFPDHADRHVSSRFLEELLTDTNAPVHRHGICIENAVFGEPIDLVNARIEHELQINNSVFLGPVDLSGSRFARSLLLRGCFFASNIVCSGLRVGGSLDFGSRKTTLPGQVRGGEFKPEVLLPALQKEPHGQGIVIEQSTPWSPSAGPGQFLLGARNHLLLSLAWDGQAVQVKQVTYLGGSLNDMKDMEIGQHLNMSDAVIAGDLRMDSLKVEGSASFEYTIFHGASSFGYARITDELNGRHCRFLNNPSANFYGLRTEGRVNFGSAMFGGDVDFSEARAGALGIWSAVFQGLADFTRVSVLNDFNAENAIFSSTNEVAFTGLQVSGNAIFEKALFTGKVQFASCTIHGEFNASQAKFFEEVNFDGLRVEGGAIFPQSLFRGTVSFKNATLNRFEVEEVKWPDGAHHVHFEGLSFGRIRAVKEDWEHEKTWQKLNERLSRSDVLSADVYEHLENFFRREGKPALANDVYIAYKRHERSKVLLPSVAAAAFKEHNPVQTLLGLWSLGWSFVRDWCTGFGRRPWQALIPSLLVVLIGCLVFPRDVMERNSLERQHPHIKPTGPERSEPPDKYLFHAPPYNRFAYSLDLFIPVLHLHYDQEWVPKTSSHWLIHAWMYVQMLLGWVLVPLFLAASSGLVH